MEDINGSLEISVVANDKNLKQEVDKAIKSLNNLGVSAKNVGDTLDDSFSDVTKTVVTGSGQMSSAIDGIGSAMDKLNEQAGAAGAELEKMTKSTNLEQIRKTLSDAGAAMENLEKDITDLQNEYQRLGKVAADAFLKGNDADYNVASQNQSAIKGEIALREKLYQELAAGTDILEQHAQELQKDTNSMQQGEGRQQSMRGRIRELREEMMQMMAAGKENTAEFKQMEQELGRLSDIMNDVGEKSRVLSNDEQNVQGLVTGLSAVTGAFTMAQGAAALFGDENEEIQKVMIKVNSLTAITTGLMSIQQVLNKDSAFSLVTLGKAKEFLGVITGKLNVVEAEGVVTTTAATGAITAEGTAATGAATATTGLAGAIKLLSSAIKKIPVIGWILAALSAVVAIITKIRGESKKIEEEEAEKQKAFQDKVAEGVAGTISKVELLAEKWKKLNTLADKSKFVQQQASAFKELGVSINSVAEAENLLVKNKDKFIQAQLDKAIAAAIIAQSEDKIKELAKDLIEQNDRQMAADKENQRRQAEAAKKTEKNLKESAKDFAYSTLASSSISISDQTAITKQMSKDEVLQNKINKQMEEIRKLYNAASFYQDRSSAILSAANITLNSDTNKTNQSVDIIGETLQMQIKNTTKEFENLFGTLKDGELAGNPFLALQYQLDELYTQLGEHKKELARQEIKDETLLAETIKSIDNETADNKKNIADKIQQYNQKQIDDRQAQIDNQVTQEKELYAELLLNYGDYQQQCKDINEKYTNAINLATKKGNQQLVATLRKQWEKELGERASEFFSQRFAKALKSDATKEELQSALDEIDELINSTYSDGNKWGINAEAWEQAVKSAKEIRKQINELAKQKNIPIVQMLKDIKESFASGDINTAMEGIMNMASLASQAVDQLASTFRELADATGSANLDKTATALEKVGTFLNETGTGASVGASVGGGWGALVGAIIGSGVGTFKLWAESEKELAEAQAKREQEGTEALQVNTQTLLDTISAMNSLADTISSLDYGQFSTVIQDALNQLNSDIKAYDSETNWRNINNALQSVDFQKRQSLEREYVEWLKANGYDISGYFDNNLTDTQATANMVNNLDYEHIQKLKELWRELSEFQRSGENDSLKLWNIQNKILIEKKNGLENEIAKYKLLGWDTAELENQLASLNLQIKENVTSMVEGLIGIDIEGIVSNWISLFEEFGNNTATIFDKISQSIDDMVRNVLKQKLIIAPLTKMMDDILSRADVSGDGELDYDEVIGAAQNLGNLKGDMQRLYDSYKDALGQLGITDSVSGTSLTSAIKGVSEETAGIIAGQMNAIRVHQIEIQEILQNNIGNNVAIIARNSAYLAYLPQMNDRLGRVESSVNDTYRQRLGV